MNKQVTWVRKAHQPNTIMRNTIAKDTLREYVKRNEVEL